ncbi:MAG: hypothetical protein M8467_08930 [Anaerolineae bacterium]|nr:hypothetical protein [Anaerolineae bacterium]
MHLVLFRDWIRRIYATRDDELGCEEVFDAIASYVDMEIAGEPAAECFPRVLAHLKQCPHCSDIYLALRAAALLEDQELARELVELEHPDSH